MRRAVAVRVAGALAPLMLSAAPATASPAPALATAAPVAAPSAASASAAALLERHRPLLRYDGAETDFAVSVEALAGGAELDRERGPRRRVRTAAFLGARYADGHPAASGDRLLSAEDPAAVRPLVYGRAARAGDGRLWLQYWLFFTDNPQDRGIPDTGRHTGDWELLQLRLGRDRRPVEATFAQHTWAEGCRWSELERRGAAPVVYVANGSHALYPRAGRGPALARPQRRGRRGRPRDAPRVEPITASSPRWMAWPGRWGEDEPGWVPGEQASPRGPAFQPERWEDPGSFHATEARACGSGPPGRPWQTALTVAAVLALAASLWALRRSYNRRP
jgi:hypothetical protein